MMNAEQELSKIERELIVRAIVRLKIVYDDMFDAYWEHAGVTSDDLDRLEDVIQGLTKA